jgi:apolipoprotein N-acyltransferase
VAAFPPLDQSWVAWFALAPFLLAVRGTSGRRGFLFGLCAGFGFFAISVYWISYFGYLAWFLLALLQALFWGVFGMIASRSDRLGRWARLVGLPLAWAGLEIARGRWPLGGFTWGDLGYSQMDGAPVVNIARWAGVFGVSAAIVCVNALLAESWVRWRARNIGFIVAAVALLFMPSMISLDVDAERTIDVAAVQGNVPRGHFTSLGRIGGRTGSEDFVVRDNHIAVTEQLVGDAPDLIVWPENSLDRDPRLPGFFEPVADVVRRVGAPMIAGAILDASENFRNSNIAVGADGTIYPVRYDKIHLVPFGEYVPWDWARKVVPALDREIPNDGTPGRDPQLLSAPLKGGVPGIPEQPVALIGSAICFESTYSELLRDMVNEGANVLLVTTNNASFGTSPAAEQHLQMSRMRALEHGRSLVHVAVAGISAIVRPDGSIRSRAGLALPAW